jgi:hypothetical protein
VVSIPDSPTAPRFTALRAELDQDELRTVVHLMRGALEHALGGSSVSVRPHRESALSPMLRLCDHARTTATCTCRAVWSCCHPFPPQTSRED